MLNYTDKFKSERVLRLKKKKLFYKTYLLFYAKINFISIYLLFFFFFMFSFSSLISRLNSRICTCIYSVIIDLLVYTSSFRFFFINFDCVIVIDWKNKKITKMKKKLLLACYTYNCRFKVRSSGLCKNLFAKFVCLKMMTVNLWCIDNI